MAEGCFTIISYPPPKNNLHSLPPTCRKGSNFANVNQRANHLIVITPSLWFLGLITVQPPCLAAVFFLPPLQHCSCTIALSFQFWSYTLPCSKRNGIVKGEQQNKQKRSNSASKKLNPNRSRAAHPLHPAKVKIDYISLSFILLHPSTQLHKGNLHTSL